MFVYTVRANHFACYITKNDVYLVLWHLACGQNILTANAVKIVFSVPFMYAVFKQFFLVRGEETYHCFVF